HIVEMTEVGRARENCVQGIDSAGRRAFAPALVFWQGVILGSSILAYESLIVKDVVGKSDNEKEKPKSDGHHDCGDRASRQDSDERRDRIQNGEEKSDRQH